jgi:hypothetical protein
MNCLHSGTRDPAQCRKLLFSRCSRMAPCLPKYYWAKIRTAYVPNRPLPVVRVLSEE